MKYSHFCNRFMEMFIISMIFRRKLRIYDGGFAHKSYNVGIMDMMIHRKNKLRVYIMAGITRSLMLRLVGSTWSCNHHQPLMMRMMRIMICRILVVTIPCLEVVYLPRSLGSGGAAEPHLHLPNELLVEVILSPGEKLKSVERYKDSLMSKVREVISRVNVECEVTVFEKSVKATITLENPEYLDRVKNILKIFQVETTKNGKQHMCKLSVKVVQPKKSDQFMDPSLRLPVFDKELLENLLKNFGENSESSIHPSFLDDRFLHMSGLFNLSDIVYLRAPVRNTRRANVYRRLDTLGLGFHSFRIAHPGCPGLLDKCLDMCRTASPSYEQNWKHVCNVDIPEEILRNSKFWNCGFLAIEK
jgi:hypothetical protein